MQQDQTTNDAYALIVGVGDYRIYDASTDRPRGTSDLAGSTNDARALYRMCRMLRIPAANIRVLSSPRLRPEDLGDGATEENLGEATHDAVLAGARWLAEKLDQPARPAGIFTWSGHGDADEARGLLLCPADTTGADLRNAVAFADLRKVFASPACRHNLTVLLDCCNAGTAAESVPTARGTSLRGRPPHPTLARARAGISERTLCAAAAGQPAYQAHFDGVARGAFSWAVSVAAEQWRLAEDGDSVYLTLSHDELIARAGRLLAALSIGQEPVLVAPARVGRMPVLKRGLMPHAGEASTDPTRPRGAIQLTGDVKVMNSAGEIVDSDYVLYTLTLADFGDGTGPTLLGKALVTRTANRDGQYQAATEYWSVDKGGNSKVSAAGSLTIEGAGGLWGDPLDFPLPPKECLNEFAIGQEVSWIEDAKGPQKETFFVQDPGSVPEGSPQVSLQWHIWNDDGSANGFMAWWQTLSVERAEPLVLGAGRFPFRQQSDLRLPSGGFTYGTGNLAPGALP